MPKTTFFAFAIFAALVLALLASPAPQAQTTPPPNPKTVPVIDGDIGPCSADFTITDNAGAPLYDATIQVHIAYGFLSTSKLDLQVGTNIDGKARFTGLPAKTKHGLFFRAVKDHREGSAFDDTDKTCKAQFTVALEAPKPSAQLRAHSQPPSLDPVVFDPRFAPPQKLFWRMRSPSPIIVPISMRGLI